MISILGRGLILLALLLCAVGAPIGFAAGAKRSKKGLRLTQILTLGFAAAMIGANLLMEYALITHDFSVHYVSQVGSLSTPLHITIVSLWSSLEGSILFWGGCLGLLAALMVYLHRNEHHDYMAYTLGTVLAVGLFFGFLIAGPADPFAPVPNPLPDGPGPNPLLQNHILMIVHPPFLYGGFVGMTAPFAMAVAALLRGQLGPTWLKPMRAWLMVPWICLTLGIMLGGWWAYEVLGWGGYWAWDPVENASFHPWLSATAALHVAVVQQRRGTLKGWTVTLIIVSFLLTIFGTFLTRSGVFNSVHSFTQSPIGPTFLVFLALVAIASVVLLAMRIDLLTPEPVEDALVSRETAIYANNLVLLAVLFTVVVGTVFPLLAEAIRDVKVSVGPPFFERMAIPLFVLLTALLAAGLALPWGRPRPGTMMRILIPPVGGLVLGIIFAAAVGAGGFILLLTIGLACAALVGALRELFRPALGRAQKQGGLGALPKTLLESVFLVPHKIGAHLAHIGLIISIVAIGVSSAYITDREVSLMPGDQTELGNYQLIYRGVTHDQQPHRTVQKATVDIMKAGIHVGTLEPSMNHYPRQQQPVATPEVRTTATHDLYLTLMSVHEDGRVGLRTIWRPMVVWVWVGILIISAGGLLCLIPPFAPRKKGAV